MNKFLAVCLLLMGFLSAAAFDARAEADVSFACRDAATVESFYSVALTINQNQDSGEILRQALAKEGFDLSCVVADADAFNYTQKLDENGDMSVVVYTDPADGSKMTLVGFSPMDQNTATSSVAIVATVPMVCKVVNKNQVYSCIHKDECSCPVE